MEIGFIISLIVVFIFVFIILAIMIPFDRKYVVRENRKINYKKMNVYLRWNTFDTVTIALAAYTIICVQILNLLLSFGETIQNPYVQFFTNQSQVWVIVTFAYFISRLTATLKSIQAHYGGTNEKD